MYVVGKDNLVLSEVVVDDSKFQLSYVDHSEDEGIVTEYLDGEYLIDGAYSYGYGLWTRFFYAIPSRIFEFPEMLQLARLTDKIDGEDLTSPGDRILSTFITP